MSVYGKGYCPFTLGQQLLDGFPTNITATLYTDTQINLEWTNTTTDEDNLIIERSTNGTTFTVLITISGGSTTYQDVNLPEGIRYYYRIRAIRDGIYSNYSNTVNQQTPIPAPDTLVATTVSSSRIDLTWNSNSIFEDGFEIYRSLDGVNYSLLFITAAAAESYSNTSLTDGERYYYRVRAFRGTVYSTNSNVSYTETLLAAPSGLILTTVSSSQINLEWTDNSDSDTGFEIERSLNGSDYSLIYTTLAGFQTYQDTGLSAYTLYYYRIRAITVDTESAYCTPVSQMTMLSSITSLIATGVTDTGIDLTWTNVPNNAGYKIEISSDGNSYTEIDSIATDSVLYHATGLESGTRYYFRIRAFNGSIYSAYSNLSNTWTSIFKVESTGDGTGVTIMRMTVSSDTTITLNGGAKFYTDIYGTENESTSITLHPGYRNEFSLKCSSGSSYMLFSNIENVINWGDGVYSGWQQNTINCASISCNKFPLPNVANVIIGGANTFSFNVNTLPSNCLLFVCSGSNIITGTISGIPLNIQYLSLGGYNSISGDLEDIPSTLVTLMIGGNNTITGDVVNLPSTLVYFSIAGNNTIYGNISDLKEGLVSIQITSNYLTGNIQNIPSSVRSFISSGTAAFTGNIANLKEGLLVFNLFGDNGTISGNVVDLPSTITDFVINNEHCTITGNIIDLPSGLTRFQAAGENNITGDIANLPVNMYYFGLSGYNTIYGDIHSLPSGIRMFQVTGLNQISEYTSGKVFNDDLLYFTLSTANGYGLSTTEIDNLIIDMSNCGWHYYGYPYGAIILTGGNAPRSSASNSAVSVLQSKNVGLVLNS